MTSDSQLLQLDTAIGPYDGLLEYPQWTSMVPLFEHNQHSYFTNGTTPFYGPINLDNSSMPHPASSNMEHGLAATSFYSEASDSFSESLSGTFSSVDPREVFTAPSPVPALSSFSTVASSFDGLMDQVYDASEPPSPPQWNPNVELSTHPAYVYFNNTQKDQASWSEECGWTLIGDSGSQANRSRTGLSTYAMVPHTTSTSSSESAMPQEVLYSLPTGLIPYQNTCYALANSEQQPITWNTGAPAQHPISYYATQAQVMMHPSAMAYATNFTHPAAQIYNYVESYAPAPQPPSLLQHTSTSQYSNSPQPALRQPCPVAAKPSGTDPATLPRTFKPINSTTTIPAPKSRAFYTNTNSTPRHSTTSVTYKDVFLVQKKSEGFSYKEIRELGNFTEAESTLRGRFRSLTKAKGARVRKPTWTKNDVSFFDLSFFPFLFLLSIPSSSRLSLVPALRSPLPSPLSTHSSPPPRFKPLPFPSYKTNHNLTTPPVTH